MKKTLLSLISFITILNLSGCGGKGELTLEDVKDKMSKGFDQYENNYRYDWGDNNEFHMLFDFHEDKEDNSALFSNGYTSIAYYYNKNIIRIETCKLDYKELTPIEGTTCTDQQIKDASGMVKLVDKTLESVDLTINDLKNAK